MAVSQFKKITHRYISADNDFYRHSYHYFLIGLMGFVLLLLALISLLLYQASHRPLPVFYAQQANGEKLLLEPYHEPNLLADTILRFASKAIVTAYTFDFVNYQKQIEQAKPYFTEAGWQSYWNSNSVQNLIQDVVEKQLFVYGIVSGTPVIANEGPLPGKDYAWRVQIPFLVTYELSTGTENRNYYVIVTVVRTSTAENPQGIGIDQIVMV